MNIDDYDRELAEHIHAEEQRQKNTINLIPSENEASQAVREASASVLMNKYSEGYPGKRYYQGNTHIDAVEELARERCKQLYGAEHANVQPLSGSPANFAIMQSFLEPGDTILGFDLSCGGHLTHGSPVNFSGRLYNVVSYGVDKQTQRIDMQEVRKLAEKHKPKMIISGHSAYPQELDFEAFAQIAADVGAYHLADISHISGLVVAGLHPSPVGHADFVTSTTHKTLRGPRGAIILTTNAHKKAVDKAVFPGVQGGAHNNQIAAKAVCFKEAMQEDFIEYQQAVLENAQAMAKQLIKRDIPLVTGGTSNHLLLIDLTDVLGAGKGRIVARTLEDVGIITNMNGIPYDTAPPYKPSGVRIGSPMITTQGLDEQDCIAIADCIADVIHGLQDEEILAEVKQRVNSICSKIE